MFSNTVQRIVKENDIKITIKDSVKRNGYTFFTHDATAFTVRRNGKIINKEILISPASKYKTISVWHELGHIIHPQGQGNGLALDKELAANEWALVNYSDHMPIELVRMILRRYILTYIYGGYKQAHGIFKPVADELNISHLINFL